MTDAVLLAIIVALPATVASVAAAVVSVVNAIRIERVATSINGQSHQLLQLTSKSARAEGVKAGRAERRRVGNQPVAAPAGAHGPQYRSKRSASALEPDET